MESVIDQLVAEELKIQQTPVDRRAQSRRGTIRHQANLAAMNDHEALLQTIVDLQNGVPVDEERRTAAAEAYQQLQKEPAAAHKASPKKPGGQTVH